MTNTAIDETGLTAVPDRATPALFAVAIFTSAALVFLVQPMATKLILPMLGGSPSVWNTAMVFFQAALLLGYLYAHLLQRIPTLKGQLAVHLALLTLAALFLPLKISGVLGEPPAGAPMGWLLATLALSVGVPFAVLSATAPLMQAWYARVRAGQAGGANPYVLYAASNLGSFLALLAYPVVVEPLMSLSHQRGAWSGGYALFMLLVVALSFLIWRRGSGTIEAPALEVSAPIAWRDKAVLVLLAAAPSSLMLGVTTYLSTDVASAPFLWVLPLALYLLTFVLAFQARPLIPLPITLVIAAGLGIVCLVYTASRSGDWTTMFALHMATFFFLSLMCHQRIAAKRPAPDRLTEFYLLMSLGGVVGGAFTALVAPVVFSTVLEYPLVLVLVGLARPISRKPIRNWEVYAFVGAVLICFIPPLLKGVFDADWNLAWAWSRNVSVSMEQTTQLILMFAVIPAVLIRDRMPAYVILCALIALVTQSIGRGYDWALTERSFFGVMRVAPTRDDRLGGQVNVLMHGTTLHGAQPRNAQFACMPTLYYAPDTPIGQVTQAVQRRVGTLAGGGVNIGVVGQGSGAMAGYKRGQDRLTFFEIDPMVNRLSRDPKWFTFINGCAQNTGPGGPVQTVIGDARLSMAKQPAGTYDLLLIDAFSSDAVPTHLLTEEAIAGYLKLLKPTGVVILHLSNRNLDLTLPTEAAARALHAPHLHQLYVENPAAPAMAEASTEVLILSPTPQGLAEFRDDRRWEVLSDQGVRPWTDDYVNLFGSVWRHLRAADR